MKIVEKIKILFLIAIPLVFFACAKQVAISGGPRDVIPPVMIEAEPANGSVNFIEKNIYVRFDEYVKLNSLTQKLIVSPPMEEDPVVIIKGKGIKISLKPELFEPNTTYSLNFNDAIADNNENNSLNSFVYAFSTGETIDSLNFSGQVLDAFTRKPITDAWVILHDIFVDSVIKTYNPGYLTKVDQNGNFFIPFVREDDYKIYALIDNNYNYMFDIPDEGIAFIDSVFHPGVELIEISDTSGNTETKYKNYPSDIKLLIFKEKKQAQFISDNKRIKPDYLEFVFNSTQYEEYFVKIPQDENAKIYAKNNPDTVKIWLKNEELINTDSIAVFVNYRDPIYTDTMRIDTIFYRKPDTKQRDSLISVATNKTKEPQKPLSLFINTPVDEIKYGKLRLELKSDSTYIKIDCKIVQDSLNPLIITLDAKILEKSDYCIIISEGFLKTESGLTNEIDTLLFSSSSTIEYGNLKITFADKELNYIIQMLRNDAIVSEMVSVEGVVDFQFLKPATYLIRAIEDCNGNGRWDTGDYDKNLQPESVYYYPTEYEVRSNWNHEIDWNLLMEK
jgi:uncharacterized protein (DUF2141 family)